MENSSGFLTTSAHFCIDKMPLHLESQDLEYYTYKVDRPGSGPDLLSGLKLLTLWRYLKILRNCSETSSFFKLNLR